MIFLYSLLIILTSSQVLDGIPITFNMLGSTTYTPDIGGSTKNGYTLKLGFSKNSWLAVQFIGTTKNDVLVLQIDDFYTHNANDLFAGHQVFITDYYKNSTGLFEDTITENDKSSYTYSKSKSYELEIIRYQGSNSGEDWNAPQLKYSMNQVCFYSGAQSFSINTWLTYSKRCYYYEFQNLISTFRGRYLKLFSFNGYIMNAFGYIDGPVLSSNLFLYQATPLYTYKQAPALILQIGTTKGANGQDYNVYSPISTQSGDYFGTSITSIAKDTTQTGFENNGLTAKFWNAVPADYIPEISTTNLLISFNRNIETFDNYDRQLLSTLSFCLFIFAEGSISNTLTEKACEIVQLSYEYPRIQIPSWGQLSKLKILLLCFISMLIMYC